MANAREAAFRAAVEEIEHEMGPMSDDEFRQFKQQWRQDNPKTSQEDPDSPTRRPSDAQHNHYVNQAYVQPDKAVRGAARSIGDWLSRAATEAKQTASGVESGMHNLKDWLSRVNEHLSIDDAHERNRKEQILERAVEHMGNKINHLLTGDSMTEQLRPEYGGDEPYNETIDFDFPARKGSKANPVRLEGQPLGMPTNAEQGIESMPEEVDKIRFRKGSRENPIRLPPIELHEDLRKGGPASSNNELRTEEVTIKVPRVAKR